MPVFRFEPPDPSALEVRRVDVDPRVERHARAWLDHFLRLLEKSPYIDLVVDPSVETAYTTFDFGRRKFRVVLGQAFFYEPPDYVHPATASQSLDVLLHELDHIMLGDVVSTDDSMPEGQTQLGEIVRVIYEVWLRAKQLRMYHPAWDKVRAQFQTDEEFVRNLKLDTAANIASDAIINNNKPFIGESNCFVTVAQLWYGLQWAAHEFITKGYAAQQGVTLADVHRYVEDVLMEFARSINRQGALKVYATAMFLMEPGAAGGGRAGVFRNPHETGNPGQKSKEFYDDRLPRDYINKVINDIQQRKNKAIEEAEVEIDEDLDPRVRQRIDPAGGFSGIAISDEPPHITGVDRIRVQPYELKAVDRMIDELIDRINRFLRKRGVIPEREPRLPGHYIDYESEGTVILTHPHEYPARELPPLAFALDRSGSMTDVEAISIAVMVRVAAWYKRRGGKVIGYTWADRAVRIPDSVINMMASLRSFVVNLPSAGGGTQVLRCLGEIENHMREKGELRDILGIVVITDAEVGGYEESDYEALETYRDHNKALWWVMPKTREAYTAAASAIFPILRPHDAAWFVSTAGYVAKYGREVRR